MNRRVCSIFLFACLGVASLDAQRPLENDIVSIFRSAAPPPGWHHSDSLRMFYGKELYQLIDGGADVYLEYGFMRAGSRRYLSPVGHEIDIEIYEMRDPESAYGIFSFLSAETGAPVPFGQEGVGSEDFLIFQKGRFVVSLTALDAGEQAALRALGKAVDTVITPDGRRPDLVDAMLRPNFHNAGVVAVKGAISFDQRAQLGLGDLFRVREGSAGLFDGCRTFILRYPGITACDSAESQAVKVLISEGGYRLVMEGDTTRLLSHPRGTLISIMRAGRHLFLTIGEGRERVQRVAFMLGRVGLKTR